MIGQLIVPDALGARFSVEDAERAGDNWGFNCGPAAIAAVCGMTPNELRPHMGDFERKGYTNPTLMWEVLKRLGIRFVTRSIASNVPTLPWPEFGLARVQWEGPWTNPGVPTAARYRHTHWVAAASHTGDWTTPGWEEPKIFDVNCMCVGGWVSLSEWSGEVVPWLLKQCEPKASGRWHITHSVEIEKRAAATPEGTRP